MRRRKRKRLAVMRAQLPAPAAANERWSMDFIRDTLADGRAFRGLTVVDDFTRECPAIEVDASLTGDRVVEVMERLERSRGRLPGSIICDNGPEFQSQALDLWAHRRGRAPGFHPSWQAGGECVHRKLQRQVPRRVPERELLHLAARREAEHRDLADRVQRRPSP